MGDDGSDAELAALLKEQAEFLKSGKPSAAKAVRVGGQPPSFARPRPPAPTDELPLPVLNPGAAPAPRPKPTAPDVPAAPSGPPVMSEIVEREPSVGQTIPERRASQFAQRSFPQAVHRSQLPASESAQLRATRQQMRAPLPASSGPRRGVALGDDEARAIDSENANTLGGMSAEEIRQAQAQLRAQLGPDLVARIQQRGAIAPATPATPPAAAPPAPPPPAAVAASLRGPPMRSETGLPPAPRAAMPSAFPTAPAMRAGAAAQPSAAAAAAAFAAADASADASAADELERLKTEWMGEADAEPPPIDEAAQRRSAEEALEAATLKLGLHDVRFDLGGALIDPTTAGEISVREGLHHHGDAPAAPGYLPSSPSLGLPSSPSHVLPSSPSLGLPSSRPPSASPAGTRWPSFRTSPARPSPHSARKRC